MEKKIASEKKGTNLLPTCYRKKKNKIKYNQKKIENTDRYP